MLLSARASILARLISISSPISQSRKLSGSNLALPLPEIAKQLDDLQFTALNLGDLAKLIEDSGIDQYFGSEDRALIGSLGIPFSQMGSLGADLSILSTQLNNAIRND